MAEHHLTLRPTVIGGDRLEDDFCVYRDGRSIGRIVLAENHVKHVEVWRWHINPPLPIPNWANGSARTREGAQAEFRAAWQRFYASLKPESITHWHAIDDARKGR
ncbi:hypothetical protein [Bradyrhizobium sp. SZCCHNS1012]|uniref:hypothetical protein n=1 Tax=Bradyrhizobium sp. SZCCHNS1012 TaxID=3057297 RepID=UPI002916FD53|nr:hypothetical protein [Bradyrhizobium sp. SZCCHNS1012]